MEMSPLACRPGLTGPHFNGYYFNILEAGVDWGGRGKVSR
jgi:hypothetical protein